jgi:hypothetical protein
LSTVGARNIDIDGTKNYFVDAIKITKIFNSSYTRRQTLCFFMILTNTTGLSILKYMFIFKI